MSAPEQLPAPQAVVTPERDSRLDQLAARYDGLKARAAEASDELEAVKDAIKAELASAAPGRDDVVLRSPHLAEPLRLHAVSTVRFDAPRFKKDDPETYVKYAKFGTSWRLEAAR